jgi:amino acid transporter
LGLVITENGGIQEYLRASYGPFFGFLFTWVWIIIAKPCAIAINSTVFTVYLCNALFTGTVPWWVTKAVGLFGITAIAFINCCGVVMGAKAANVFLFVKVILIFFIGVSGAIAAASGVGNGIAASNNGWLDVYPEARDQSTWDRIGNFVTALFGALFSYGGWETVRRNFYLLSRHDTELTHK